MKGEKPLGEELYDLFRRNFPYVLRREQTAKSVLSHPENKVFESRREDGSLNGACVLHKDTVYLLCVDEDSRRRGIGNDLLEQAETFLREKGEKVIRIGAGEDYLTPGVPTAVMPFSQPLWEEALPKELLKEDFTGFFRKRGYRHSWGEGNCFDLIAELTEVDLKKIGLEKRFEGIAFRFGVPEDLFQVLSCVQDAEEEFLPFYQAASLYEEGSSSRALLAVRNGEVLGAILVSEEGEGESTGSLGCTAVARRHQGQGIAKRLVAEGTAYLKAKGLEKSFIGYTYSGLQRLYGPAGYRISCYYDMAEKELSPLFH